MTTIEIRPADGGAEAERFAHELAAGVASYITRNGYAATQPATASRNVVVDTDSPSDAVGWLAGTHKVQRASGGARHTSTATLVILDDAPASVAVT